MRITVTGSSGFIGSNLVQYIEQEKLGEIIALNLRIPLPATSDSTAFIHLAGKAHDTNNTSSLDEYFQVNTELTKQLFDLFLKSQAKDFIYFSSVKAVTDRVSDILDEEAVSSPGTPYGQSKLKAETYILSQSLPAGKRAIILRPCMVHGPGNKGNLNLLYRIVRKRIPYPLAAFKNERSFLSIRNLFFIVAHLLDNPLIPGGIYNVADDEPLSSLELIKIIGDGSGVRPRMWKLPPAFIKTVAKAGDRLKFPFNSERLRKLTESYVVSNQKIKEALGIRSLPVSSREGMLETIKSFSC